MVANIKIQKADLYADWVGIAKERLIRSGFDVSALQPTASLTLEDAISLAYFNALLHLTIPAHPRTVQKTAAFICPPDLASGLAAFEAKVIAGESLRPHMSRGTKELDNRDGLRYDWGIHHFHLGTELDPDGFVKRTGPLVFAWVEADAMYLINVMAHGAWSQQQVLTTVHENWPHLLEPYKLGTDVISLEQNFSDKEIARFRKSQINAPLQVADNVFIVAPGGGFTASGHSSEVADRHVYNRRNLLAINDEIHALTSRFVVEPLRDGLITNPSLCYSLVEFDENKYGLQEENNEFHYVLDGPAEGLPKL